MLNVPVNNFSVMLGLGITSTFWVVVVVVVVLGFYVSPTAKVIRRRDLGLKSHPKDWRSPGLFGGVNVPCSRTRHGLTRVGLERP